MNEERILTQHPAGKKGVNILIHKYDLIRDYIISIISKHVEISYQELSDLAVKDLSDTFDGKVVWYIVSIKLDLEAKKIIERIPKTSPHRLRMYQV